jgi:anion-transporting  ArsA/GET3 family ATPase
MTYEFFTLLSNEIDRQQKARNQEATTRLTGLRERLLAIQEEVRQQTQQMLQAAKQTLDMLLAADDKAAAVRANLPRIDDTVVRLLMAEMSRAEQSGRRDDLRAMQELQNVIVQEMNQASPPELELLNELLTAGTEAERRELLDQNEDLLSPEFLEVLEMIEEQVRQTGPSGNSQELLRNLDEVKAMIVAELGAGV